MSNASACRGVLKRKGGVHVNAGHAASDEHSSAGPSGPRTKGMWAPACWYSMLSQRMMASHRQMRHSGRSAATCQKVKGDLRRNTLRRGLVLTVNQCGFLRCFAGSHAPLPSEECLCGMCAAIVLPFSRQTVRATLAQKMSM